MRGCVGFGAVEWWCGGTCLKMQTAGQQGRVVTTSNPNHGFLLVKTLQNAENTTDQSSKDKCPVIPWHGIMKTFFCKFQQIKPFVFTLYSLYWCLTPELWSGGVLYTINNNHNNKVCCLVSSAMSMYSYRVPMAAWGSEEPWLMGCFLSLFIWPRGRKSPDLRPIFHTSKVRGN